LQDKRVNVTAWFLEQGSVLRGDAEGMCERFEVEVAIDSEEPPEAIAGLIRVARRMCFTEAALTGPVPISHRHLLNGQPLAAE